MRIVESMMAQPGAFILVRSKTTACFTAQSQQRSSVSNGEHPNPSVYTIQKFV